MTMKKSMIAMVVATLFVSGGATAAFTTGMSGDALVTEVTTQKNANVGVVAMIAAAVAANIDLTTLITLMINAGYNASDVITEAVIAGATSGEATSGAQAARTRPSDADITAAINAGNTRLAGQSSGNGGGGFGTGGISGAGGSGNSSLR